MNKEQFKFVPLCEQDREDYIQLAEQFYHSDSVQESIPNTHFEQAFEEVMKKNPMLQIIMIKENDKNIGYGLLMFDYSVEAGGLQLWIDELYIEPTHRGQGLGNAFLDFVDEIYVSKVKRIRLEVVPEKERLIKLYAKHGYGDWYYKQMYKEMTR